MANVIIVVIIAILVGSAARYIYKAKKSGAHCIGCSSGGTCGGCGCGCEKDDKNL